jgi:prepilin signal peptidase PulO-like enzyme (type II secretory pathway)
LWLFPRIGLGLPLSLILLIYFGIVIVIDIEHRLILHTTSLFGALLGLIIGIYTQSKLNGLSAAIFTSLLGGVAGFVFMFLIYKGGELVARYRARKMRAAGLEEDDEEAFGSADVILTSILGLMLGWPNIILGLFTSAIIGGVIALLAVIQTFVKRRRAPDTLMTFIPYGPALVLGAFYILYFF